MNVKISIKSYQIREHYYALQITTWNKICKWNIKFSLFWANVSFYNSWKYQKTSNFLIFSGSIEWVHASIQYKTKTNN